jgi:phosphatidate phosphatase APP1
MRQCYIIDIDGTVADLTHRRHFVENKPKNWPAFNAACKDDTPIPHMATLLDHLYDCSRVRIVYMSGRNEAMREATVEWLERHSFPIGSGLYMRADGDYRDDGIVKLELLQRLRADGFEPIMAFDDRDRVVKMWRDNGVPCAQVAPGDF